MYALEHKSEAERLEEQARQKDYSLTDELRYLQLSKGDKVLDAGCGSGLLCKHLAKNFADIFITGYDFSDIRVKQAEQGLKEEGIKNVKIQRNDLHDISCQDNEFDVIINRFVIEHLSDPLRALSELKRTLKPGGQIYLIDLDGVWINMFTNNSKFNLMMDKVRTQLGVDFIAGRKMGLMLSQLGFNNIQWDVTTHVFKGEELLKEHANNQARCHILWPKLVSIFGGEQEAKYFVDTFLTEMLRPEVPVFHNKFIVRGTK